MKFLRYPGGKGKLLQFLEGRIPDNTQIKGRYIEPFVGGGSVFLHVQPNRAIISDLNKDLVDLYRGIRNYPHRVWETFAHFPEGREAYYKIRDAEYRDKPLYYRAARILYLNRTCFKGLWRHNPSGNFNVGYGGEERRWVDTHQNIVELAKRFRKASTLQADFEAILDQCRDDDFIFLDPPYKPGEKELLEAHYTHGRFSFEDQIRLSKKLKEISTHYSIRWLMTNSSNCDICELYKDFNITRIPRGTGNVVGVCSASGKSNVVKLIAQSLIETTSETKNVGQLIFDMDGEYANDNPQDGNLSIRSAYPDRCIVYALTKKEKTDSKPLRMDFYEHPQSSHNIVAVCMYLPVREGNLSNTLQFQI